ncbi:MAG: cytochrome c biogenesis protein CcsA [Deinococcales bacterium]
MKNANWLTPALGYSSLLVLVVAFFFTFTAPPDTLQGYLTRILPVHVGSSWLAYLSFGLTAIFGLTYLVTRNSHWDRLSLASTEIGVIFIVLSLFSGALWGRPAWGTYWEWGDARLTTTALMLMVYVGMLMIRGMIEDPSRCARVSAVLGVVASVGVPINYMSVYWWSTLHQTPTLSIAERRSALENPGILIGFVLALLGFTILYFYLIRLRSQMALTQARLEQQELELELKGAIAHD